MSEDGKGNFAAAPLIALCLQLGPHRGFTKAGELSDVDPEPGQKCSDDCFGSGLLRETLLHTR